MTTQYPPGTQVIIRGTPSFLHWPGVSDEVVTVCRPRKENLPMLDGYLLVKFSDGGKLAVHTSRISAALGGAK